MSVGLDDVKCTVDIVARIVVSIRCCEVMRVTARRGARAAKWVFGANWASYVDAAERRRLTY
jgi:hypothetical protein